ncbi:acyl-CoA dehydrogenase family protein [Microbacterium pumilum]|uniref:Acyl-CoA dehydrogenase n=1 Tax=Microbacterium pumilum TaxID=344165 RepID=A0ABP5EH02_9MICO
MSIITEQSEPAPASAVRTPASVDAGDPAHGDTASTAGVSDRVTLAPTAAAGPSDAVSESIETALDSARQIARLGVDIATTLDWCVEVGATAPRPGSGGTTQLWELLAGTAALDVAAARILEPHLDALAILEQSGTDLARGRDPWGVGAVRATPRSSWGVYAAEAPGSTLRATRNPEAWTLNGTKAWCSLAQDASHALVTALVDDANRGLFAVDLRAQGVTAQPGPWHARGLPQIVSAPVAFADVPAIAVGEPGWYLQRPGFAWGGMSVAAVWWGAAAPLLGSLSAAASSARADQLSLMHLGRADAALWGARAVLAEAATLIDLGGAADRRSSKLLAERVRTIVVDAVTLTMAEADAALGPAPLVGDASFARRVSDLHLYLRQHHGLRDVARIGCELTSWEQSS